LTEPNLKINNPKQSIFILKLMFGAILISFSGVLVKIADGAGPITAGFYRMLFGGISLIIFVLIKEKKINLKQFKTKKLYPAFICSLFFAADLTCWHKSIIGVGPGLATLLGNFQVFFLAGFGIIILKEKINFKTILSIILAFFGIILLVCPNWSGLPASWKLGVFYGFLTAAAYSCYIVTLRRLQTKADFLDIIWNMIAISLLTAFIMAAEIIIFKESFVIENNKSFLFLLAYGVLQQSLGWVLIGGSLPHLKVSTAGLILLLQPSLSFVWDIIFFNRVTTGLDIAGVCIAIGAIYLGSAVKSDA